MATMITPAPQTSFGERLQSWMATWSTGRRAGLLVGAGLVLAAMLLMSFVQTVHAAGERGEAFRQAQLSAPVQPDPAVEPMAPPGDQLALLGR